MIRITLEPDELVFNRSNQVLIKVSNEGRTNYTDVVFKLALPTKIVLLGGRDLIEIPRLDKGQTTAYTVRLRPKESGKWTITSSNFAYRNHRGETHHVSDWSQDILVRDGEPEPPMAEFRVELQTGELVFSQWGELRGRLINTGSVNLRRVTIAAIGPVKCDLVAPQQSLGPLRAGKEASFSLRVLAQEMGSHVPLYFEVVWTDEFDRSFRRKLLTPIQVAGFRTSADGLGNRGGRPVISRYNIRNVRSFLTHGFTSEELRRLCYDIDDLRPVYDELAVNTGKGQIIDLVIEYAESRSILDRLLALTRDQSPLAYDKHQPYFASERPTETGRPASDRTAAMTVLLMAADPSDLTRLRLGREFREIQDKLGSGSTRDSFRVHQIMSIRPVDVSGALLRLKPDIVHFSGHGNKAGGLFFENDSGTIHVIEPVALARLFSLVSAHVKCVVLNACYSEIQAAALETHIRYVIGMSKTIGDDAAISFAVGFYQALAAGRSIEDAHDFGCAQIGLQGLPDYLTPVLTKQS